jgi:hypothetical protein
VGGGLRFAVFGLLFAVCCLLFSIGGGIVGSGFDFVLFSFTPPEG